MQPNLFLEDRTGCWGFVRLFRAGSGEENDRSWEQARGSKKAGELGRGQGAKKTGAKAGWVGHGRGRLGDVLKRGFGGREYKSFLGSLAACQVM